MVALGVQAYGTVRCVVGDDPVEVTRHQQEGGHLQRRPGVKPDGGTAGSMDRRDWPLEPPEPGWVGWGCSGCIWRLSWGAGVARQMAMRRRHPNGHEEATRAWRWRASWSVWAARSARSAATSCSPRRVSIPGRAGQAPSARHSACRGQGRHVPGKGSLVRKRGCGEAPARSGSSPSGDRCGCYLLRSPGVVVHSTCACAGLKPGRRRKSALCLSVAGAAALYALGSRVAGLDSRHAATAAVRAVSSAATRQPEGCVKGDQAQVRPAPVSGQTGPAQGPAAWGRRQCPRGRPAKAQEMRLDPRTPAHRHLLDCHYT